MSEEQEVEDVAVDNPDDPDRSWSQNLDRPTDLVQSQYLLFSLLQNQNLLLSLVQNQNQNLLLSLAQNLSVHLILAYDPDKDQGQGFNGDKDPCKEGEFQMRFEKL